jgi:ribosomal protein L40E
MTPAAAAAAAAAHAQRPTAQTPTAQQPSTVKQPPRPDPKITAVEQAIKAGDLVCSQCGSGNDPSRKFCRKCGNSLAQAVTAAKVPWWKRIFGGKKAGGRVSKEAGSGDKRRQKARDASFKAEMAMANLRKGAMILIMLGVVGSFAVPSVRGEIMRRSKDGFSSVQDMFNPQISPVNAIAVASTSFVPTHEANLAADLVVNSYWAEGAEGEGVGQTISFTFAEPTDLTKVLITGGSTDTPENYVNNPRPKEIHLVFDTGGSADLKLIDAEFRKSQGFNLKGAKGVTKVDLVISSVYPGRGGTETGIAEVEFKKKG